MIERVRERRTLFVSASLRLLLAALYGIRQIGRDAKRCVALPCYAPLPLPHFPTSLSPLLHTVFALSVFVVLFFSLFALLCFGFCVFFCVCVCVYGSVCVWVCVASVFAGRCPCGSFGVVPGRYPIYREKSIFILHAFCARFCFGFCFCPCPRPVSRVAATANSPSPTPLSPLPLCWGGL